jgi:acyl carrier protein
MPDPIQTPPIALDLTLPDARIEAVILAMIREAKPEVQAGPNDDLFELGCDSIDAAKLINRVRTTYNIDFDLEGVFQEPTARGFARQVDLALREAVAALSAEEADGLLEFGASEAL